MRAAVAAVALLGIGGWLMASSPQSASVHSKKVIPVKIIGEEEGRLWGQTVYPPLMSFRVTAGKAPDKGTIDLCTVVTVKKQVGDQLFNTISLRCEEGLVMELEGIDLGGGQ